MARHGCLVACLASLALAGAAAAQSPDPPAPPVPEPVPVAPALPQLIQEPPTLPVPPRVWASAEYVAFMIGTGKMVEVTKEAYNSELFNELLAAAGKDFRDVVRTALGDDRTGVRLRAGAWLDDTHTLGAEVGFLYLNRGPLNLSLGNRDASPLARIAAGANLTLQPGQRFDPSFDNVRHPLLALLLLHRFGVPALDANGRQIVVPLSALDLVNASAAMEIAAKTLWMFDVVGRARLAGGQFAWADGLLGYRHIHYADSLAVYHQVTTLQRPLLPGTRLSTLETVSTDNGYDGALVGLDLGLTYGFWTFSARPTVTVASLSAGATRDADSFTFLASGARGHIKGGAFLAGSDVGNMSTSKWTVIPELATSATRLLGDNVRLTLGSSLLYLPDVARSANQVSFGVDRSQTVAERLGIPKLPNPTAPDLKSAFAITMSAGLEFRY